MLAGEILSKRVENHHSTNLKMLSNNLSSSMGITPPWQETSLLPPTMLGLWFPEHPLGLSPSASAGTLSHLRSHVPALPVLLALCFVCVRGFWLLFGTSFLCFLGGQMCKCCLSLPRSQVVPLSQRVFFLKAIAHKSVSSASLKEAMYSFG